jgi:hypothetical protein
MREVEALRIQRWPTVAAPEPNMFVSSPLLPFIVVDFVVFGLFDGELEVEDAVASEEPLGPGPVLPPEAVGSVDDADTEGDGDGEGDGGVDSRFDDFSPSDAVGGETGSHCKGFLWIRRNSSACSCVNVSTTPLLSLFPASDGAFQPDAAFGSAGLGDGFDFGVRAGGGGGVVLRGEVC